VRLTRTPAPLALAALAAFALAGCTSTATAGTAQPATSSSASPAASGAPSPSPSASPSASPTPFTGTLKVGSTGEPVRQLQQRLAELGYWNGTADGKFGTLTEQAVWALQKAAGLAPSGATTPQTWAALAAGTRPAAKSTSGHVIEVDLKHNLLLFVTNGHVDTILNTSTGGGYSYVSEGRRQVAITPKGHFSTYRTIDGNHKSPLGWMYRPRYFFEGVAIHGDSSVPNHPVSHGCVRVTDAAMDWVWANNLDPVGTAVWVY
jgi:peptidoglycan hydrolase-like protein with peptidoglycan-binding domain